LAFADYGKVTTRLAADGGDAELQIAAFTRSGIDIDRLAEDLQRQGTEAFSRSWAELLACLALKREAVNRSHRNVG
jgi:transaldolase